MTANCTAFKNNTRHASASFAEAASFCTNTASNFGIAMVMGVIIMASIIICTIVFVNAFRLTRVVFLSILFSIYVYIYERPRGRMKSN